MGKTLRAGWFILMLLLTGLDEELVTQIINATI